MTDVERGSEPTGGLGLASERLGFGPATLQTVVHDHVILRTPTRPDHWPGNALHLFSPPTDLGDSFVRFDRSVGALPGVKRRVVAWETAGPDSTPGADVPDDVRLYSTEIGVIQPGGVPPSRPIPAGVQIVRAQTPHQWAGAKVLYLQTDWEGGEPYWRWHVDQQRELAEAGAGVVLVAYRAGIPIGRVSLFVTHEGAQPRIDRLSVVEDVIVHPLHRGQGVASALVSAVVDLARRLLPDMRVVVRSDPGSDVASWYARLGFEPVGRIWTAVDTSDEDDAGSGASGQR